MTENNDRTKPARAGGVTGRGFKPGQSGNPGGRPAIAREFAALCREYADAPDGGVAQLVQMATNKGSPHYYRANELLIAYAYGKPRERLEITGDDGGPLRFLEILDPVQFENLGQLIDNAKYRVKEDQEDDAPAETPGGD